MVKLSKALFLLLILNFYHIETLKADDIKIQAITSSFPPLQMQKGDQSEGFTVNTIKTLVDVVNIANNSSIKIEFKFLPWKRALKVANSNSPNILFFAISRSPQRENKYQWIAPISQYDIHLFTLDKKLLEQQLTMKAIRESEQIVGVQSGSSTEEYLLSLNFIKGSDYLTYTDYREGIRMLYRKRLDYIPMTSFLARGNVCNENLNPEKLFKGIRLNEISNPLWAVFSKKTSKKLVQQFSTLLNQINRDIDYQAGVNKEIKIWTDMVCFDEVNS